MGGAARLDSIAAASDHPVVQLSQPLNAGARESVTFLMSIARFASCAAADSDAHARRLNSKPNKQQQPAARFISNKRRRCVLNG
jgi:hypothetical protein